MNIYKCKSSKLPGSSYDEVLPLAREIYRNITKKTKRTPYIRSAYFNGEKIFLNVFWAHMSQKNSRDRARRLKFYACAIELLKYSKHKPEKIKNPSGKREMLSKFYGISRDGGRFSVQIKTDTRNGKHLISIFPNK